MDYCSYIYSLSFKKQIIVLNGKIKPIFLILFFLYRDLTFNHLSRLDDSSFLGLSLLNTLHIGNNRVNYIADCAFRGLSSLKTL
jgi:hypothetical protein